MIRSSRRGQYVARVGIFLIMAALIARMIGRGERVVLPDELAGAAGQPGIPGRLRLTPPSCRFRSVPRHREIRDVSRGSGVV
jgi:hypothetical protein